MATQREILVLDEATPQVMAPQVGVDSYLASGTLDAATGNEVFFDISYTVNKASSGNDTGLLVSMTDTASPGTSLLADFQVGGASKFSVDNAGAVIFGNASQNNLSFLAGAANAIDGRWGATIRSRIQLAAGTGYDIILQDRSPATITTSKVEVAYASARTNSSGSSALFQINPTYNSSGTAGHTDLLINRTETAVGSGSQYLADFQVGGSSKASIDNTGMLVCDEIYGHFYEYGSANSITITTGGTYYGWTTATAKVNGMTADTADATADHFTITEAGEYWIEGSFSFNAGNNDQVQGAIHVGGTINADCPRFSRTMGATAALGVASIGGVVTLSASDEVSMRFTSNTDADVIAIEDFSLTIKRIGA